MRVTLYRQLVVAGCLLSFAVAAPAQARRASTRKAAAPPLSTSWKLISIEAKGSQRYTQEEVVAASGLQLGQTVSEDDFKKATQTLGESGVFGDVSYGYAYSGEGAKLEITVSDVAQLVPARFDNFVWFSDEELQKTLHERVPLFKDGLLPLTGDLADQVSNVLQALLIQKKVQGQADYVRAGKSGSLESMLYTVNAHTIHIRNTDFTGAGAAERPLLTAAGKRLEGQEYTRSRVEAEEKHGFLPIYLERGHLKASFGAAQPKVVKDGEDETVVDVTVPVAPGLQYKLTQIDWSGNAAFSTEQLQGLVQLKAGQVADALLLDKNLKDVRRLYGTKGYMAPSIESKPEMQDSDATVRYTIEIHEGDIFHMGEIEIRGVDEKTREKLLFNWRLKQGDTYDSGYIDRFVKSTHNELPVGFEWNVVPNEAVNDDRTVDVTLRYENGTAQ